MAFTPPQSQFQSLFETGSLSNSLGSDFPSYGLIRVSDSPIDASLTSCDSLSFQINRPGTYNGSKTRRPVSNVESLNISFHGTTNVMPTRETSKRIENTDFMSSHLTLRLRTTHPMEESVSDLSSLEGIDYSREMLSRIVESRHSETGIFFSKSLFLSPKIYATSETISNGSVKVNIIQEINELLRKFLPSSNGNTTIESSAVIRTTLDYYTRLMDAFEVVRFQDGSGMNLAQESESLETSSFLSLTKRIYTTDSLDSRTSHLQNSSSPTKKTQEPSRKLGESGTLLGKLKSKIKPKSSSRSTRVHDNRILTHSRAQSTSTLNSHISTSRSLKDQTSLNDYFQAVEFLHKTVTEVWDVYSDSGHEDIRSRLNLVIQFLQDYILQFVMEDTVGLVKKFIKKSVYDYYI